MKYPAFILALLICAPLHATDIWVTDIADDLDLTNGTCNLREAIMASNTNNPADACPQGTAEDRIFFAKTGVIDLLEKLPSIFRNLEIVGPGKDLLTINGDFHDSVLDFAAGGRIFKVSGVTIRGGSGQTGGGIAVAGILLDYGSLLIRDCDIVDNFARTGGGGISSRFTDLTLQRVNIIDNIVTQTASSYGDGGGLKHEDGFLIIEDSSISKNTATRNGGGISAETPREVLITRSTISGNQSLQTGGIFLDTTGDNQEITLTHNTVVFNLETINSVSDEAIGIHLLCYSNPSMILSIINNIVADNSNQVLGLQKDLGLDEIGGNCLSSIGSKSNFIGAIPAIYSSLWPVGNPNVNEDFVGDNLTPLVLNVGPLSLNGKATSHHALLPTSTNLVDQGRCANETHDQVRNTGNLSNPDREVDIVSIPNITEACDIGAIEYRANNLRHDIQADVFLDGPYFEMPSILGGGMSIDLHNAGLIPGAHPYDVSPWNHGGGEFLNPIPIGMVDWVLVRIWKGGYLDPGGLVEVDTRAYGLLGNGELVNSTGSGYFNFDAGNYFVTIEHRNHLGVMSATPLEFSWDEPVIYDFSYDAGQAFSQGGQAMRDRGGVWTMWAGDGDYSGDVTAFDFLNVWLPDNGSPSGYKASDFNMDGEVTAFDFLNAWLPANGQQSQY